MGLNSGVDAPFCVTYQATGNPADVEDQRSEVCFDGQEGEDKQGVVVIKKDDITELDESFTIILSLGDTSGRTGIRFDLPNNDRFVAEIPNDEIAVISVEPVEQIESEPRFIFAATI